jgi:hypothetical protein
MPIGSYHWQLPTRGRICFAAAKAALDLAAWLAACTNCAIQTSYFYIQITHVTHYNTHLHFSMYSSTGTTPSGSCRSAAPALLLPHQPLDMAALLTAYAQTVLVKLVTSTLRIIHVTCYNNHLHFSMYSSTGTTPSGSCRSAAPALLLPKHQGSVSGSITGCSSVCQKAQRWLWLQLGVVQGLGRFAQRQ